MIKIKKKKKKKKKETIRWHIPLTLRSVVLGFSCFVQGAMAVEQQGLNLGFLHCRQILYHLSHQGNPMHRNGQG